MKRIRRILLGFCAAAVIIGLLGCSAGTSGSSANNSDYGQVVVDPVANVASYAPPSAVINSVTSVTATFPTSAVVAAFTKNSATGYWTLNLASTSSTQFSGAITGSYTMNCTAIISSLSSPSVALPVTPSSTVTLNIGSGSSSVGPPGPPSF